MAPTEIFRRLCVVSDPGAHKIGVIGWKAERKRGIRADRLGTAINERRIWRLSDDLLVTMIRVLVVDDDAVIGMLLAEMLGEMGLDVCGIEMTERGAIDAALRLIPDLIIVDAGLASGSGVAAMAAIERRGRIPHVFMSGARVLADLHGAPMLLKPFSEEALEAAIRLAMTQDLQRAS